MANLLRRIGGFFISIEVMILVFGLGFGLMCIMAAGILIPKVHDKGVKIFQEAFAPLLRKFFPENKRV